MTWQTNFRRGAANCGVGGTGFYNHNDNSQNNTLRFAIHNSGVTTDFRSCIETDNGSRSPPIYGYTGSENPYKDNAHTINADDEKAMIVNTDNQN